MHDRTFVIAEAGVNHNGDLRIAEQLVDAAAEAGVDAIKFQTFRADQVVSRYAVKAAYQARQTTPEQSQFEMIRSLELTADQHETLLQRSRSRGIEFLSTPFDVESLHMLTARFGLEVIKVASGEITNAPLLLAVARASRRIILSTGMSDLAEIEAALGVIAFGFTAPADAAPGPGDFAAAFASDRGQSELAERVILLHCTTEYPAPYDEVNLRALDTLAAFFKLPVGYSDHTVGLHVSLAAVALGARVIEKHFTIDRALPGPDHAASIEPAELAELVRQVRDVERAMGDGVKQPTVSESKNKKVARRTLVAAREIRAGETFTAENVACKRAGEGASPFDYWRVIGGTAARAYAPDERLDV